jgi:ankyrin repeat protein
VLCNAGTSPSSRQTECVEEEEEELLCDWGGTMSGGNVHAFARRGDLAGLQQQVEDYAADVNEPDVHRMTPLHYGAKRGNLDVVRYLVQKKADKEARNGTGQTALLAAAQTGQADVADFLIASGADPNAEADHGVRPLHRAAAAGHEEVVRVLLKGRADPLAIDGFLMESAVHHAAREGHADVVRALMGSVARPQKGLDDDEDSEGTEAALKRAFLEGAGTGGPGVAGITGLRAGSVDAGNSRGETALHLAAAHGRVECVRLLLKMSTDSWKIWWIERKDGRTGDTALHRACAEGQEEVVRLLLDEKANPSLTNQLGRTPLHLAVKAGEATIVKYLMRAGASHMSIDIDGRRPIAADAGPWASPPPDALNVEYWYQPCFLALLRESESEIC